MLLCRLAELKTGGRAGDDPCCWCLCSIAKAPPCRRCLHYQSLIRCLGILLAFNPCSTATDSRAWAPLSRMGGRAESNGLFRDGFGEVELGSIANVAGKYGIDGSGILEDGPGPRSRRGFRTAF